MWGLRFRVWGLEFRCVCFEEIQGFKTGYWTIKTLLVCRGRPKTVWGLWEFSIGISEDDLGFTF